MCPWSWRNGDTSSLIRSWQNRRSLMRACWQNQSGGLEWWSATVTGHPPLPTISPPALPQDGAELFSPLILPPGTSFNWNRCSNDFPLASMQLTILFASYLNHEHFSCLNFQPDTRVLHHTPHFLTQCTISFLSALDKAPSWLLRPFCCIQQVWSLRVCTFLLDFHSAPRSLDKRCLIIIS